MKMLPNLEYNRTARSRLSRVHINRKTSCWEWTGAKKAQGYGKINENGKQRNAHRVFWEMFYGPIEDGLVCCHVCDNRKCVNPSHLFLGTQADNLRDMTAKGRRASRPGMATVTAKLSDADVLEIRRLADSGADNWSDVARKFGVSYGTISKVVTRRSWGHISEDDGFIKIDKDKWDRLVELYGYLKHAASEAGVMTKGDEIRDIIQEVNK